MQKSEKQQELIVNRNKKVEQKMKKLPEVNESFKELYRMLVAAVEPGQKEGGSIMLEGLKRLLTLAGQQRRKLND